MARYTDTELLDYLEETRHRKEFINKQVGHFSVATDISILNPHSVTIYLRNAIADNEAVFHGNNIRQALEEMVDYYKAKRDQHG